MNKISLIKKIELLAKGKYPHWISGADFEVLAMNSGMKAANAGRRCRELFTRGIFERRITDGHVEYRWHSGSAQTENHPTRTSNAPYGSESGQEKWVTELIPLVSSGIMARLKEIPTFKPKVANQKLFG